MIYSTGFVKKNIESKHTILSSMLVFVIDVVYTHYKDCGKFELPADWEVVVHWK